MNIQEAIAVYNSDETYENICNDEFTPPIKLICDRNTKRVFSSNGNYFDMQIEHLMSDGWYVIKNQ